MRWAAVAALVLAVACSGGSDGSTASDVAPVATERPATTTVALTPDEAYLADLHDAVDFNNPEWGEQAIAVARQVCDSLDASQLLMDGDAPNDTPQTDAALADWYADTTLSVIYQEGGEDQQATASVLVLGARHFCPEWSAVVEGDATIRGFSV